MSKKTDRLAQTVTEALSEDDFYLYWLDWGKQGDRWVLEVTIDRDGGSVSSAGCADASRKVSAGLDRANLIDRSYELQVSSPGIERPLLEPHHYELAEGETVEVKTFAKVEGKKKFEGKLLGYDLEEDIVQIDCEGDIIDLPAADIARATTKQID